MTSQPSQIAQKIPVVVSCDKNYARYAKVMFASLLDNLADGLLCELIVLHKNLDADSQNTLTDFAAQRKNCVLRFLEIPERFFEKHRFFVSNHITESAYYRLFIADLLPEYERAIYLDIDTVVVGDISTLFNVDFGDNYLAAVPDIFFYPINRAYAEDVLGIPKDYPYFNSGVLLMNLRQFRQDHMTETFLQLNRKMGTPRFHDQDFLNVACLHKTLFLGYDWNFQIHDLYLQVDPAVSKILPQIIHFIGCEKPWKHPEHPNAQIWWKYCREEAADALRCQPKKMLQTEKKYELPEKIQRSIYQIWDIHCRFADLFRDYLKKAPDAIENLCGILYDETSRETVRLGMERLLAHPPQKYAEAFFYQPAKLLTNEEKYDWSRHTAAHPLYRNTFHGLFDFYEPTEFYYRHGMIWMSDSFLERLKRGVFFDCGAFNGASSLVMSLYQPSHIYLFEPSKSNYRQCCENLKKGQVRADCTIVNSCCGNADGAINLAGDGQSVSAVGSGEPVPVCKLDNFIQKNKIPRADWIKADLEGFSLEMIRGAEQTVKQWKPLLTIGVYHSPDEFFELPYLLKKWVPEYQFMYRRCQCRPDFFYNEITLIAWVPTPGEELQGIKNVDRYLGPF